MTLSTYERELLAELEAESEYENEWESELEADYFGWDDVKQVARRGAQSVQNLGATIFPEDSYRRRVALNAARAALTGGGGALGTVLAGGPGFGTALGATAGGALGGLLPQREFEDEFEWELEGEVNQSQQRYTDALMEHLGQAAATAESEAEAEAFIGALLPLAAQLIPRVAPAIMRNAPNLISGLAAATRNLRRSPTTRPLVRAIPTIVRRTAASMNQQQAQGVPVTPKTAVQTLAKQTYGVIGNPQRSVQALKRSQAMNQRYQQMAARKGVQQEEADYFDKDTVLDNFQRGPHWQGVDFNITSEQVYQLLENATRRRGELGRKATALLDAMENGWTITAGGHAGGLGGGGRGADPNPHVTIRVGRVTYHLQYRIRQGQMILINITP
jgi:hypothetical protein